MSKFGLLITRNDIIKNTPLGGAIDADALLPFIRTAQEKYILNILGTVLYNKLQDDIESQTTFTGIYEQLVRFPNRLFKRDTRVLSICW